MNQQQILVIIVLSLLAGLACIALCLSPSVSDPVIQDRESPESIPSPQVISPDPGKPCTSNEAWRAKADEIGAWSGGILVKPSMSNDEIIGMLAEYTIPNENTVEISSPRHIGYYLIVNETRDRQLLDDLMMHPLQWNMSFSSHETAFFSPEKEAQGDMVVIPVFLLSGIEMDEALLLENLRSRGVPIRTTTVVRPGSFPSIDRAERERIFHELDLDPRVLFAFKEYHEGVLC